jgi:hypothetical protein
MKLSSYQGARTPRMFPDHHLVPDPPLLLRLYQDKAQSAHIGNPCGNPLGGCNRLRKSSRAPTPWLHEGLRQNKAALGLQFPESLKATACLSSAPSIKKTVVLAELFRNLCSVLAAVLIKHPTDMLDLFRPRKCSFDLALSFHADRLHDMERFVQHYFMGNGQG